MRPTLAWESNNRTSGATLGQQPGRYLPRKWNLARICVGGVMCMRRAVTLMVSKTTLRPLHIAGEERDRFMVSKHGFGYFELDHVHVCVGGGSM